MSSGQSRRPLGLLMIIVVAALVVGGIVQERAKTPATARQDLARHLDASEPPSRFAMHYNRGGTRVLDCIALNLRYTARVDTDAQRMVITTSGVDTASVVVESSQVLLRRTLFANAPGDNQWLSVPRPFAATARKTLTDVLGVDLATAVTSPRLPASGTELASAALSIARSVRRLPSSEVDGENADGFRVLVDRRGYERDATTLPGQTGNSPTLPVFDVWVDADNEVRRITVNSETSGGKAGPVEDSWTMDFEKLRSVGRPSIVSSGPVTASDLGQLRGVIRPCEVPLGTGDA